MANKWRERLEHFRQWQRRPYEVAPLSTEEHDCTTCGTHFQGNYCPRCGQSARIGRYSFKRAALLLLDVWGLGNRGMFRTLRDLILRPGYMIRDYLGGMQMAYFPPFKLLFLLATLSLIVAGGFNIEGRNQTAELLEGFEKGLTEQPIVEITAEGETVDDAEALKMRQTQEQINARFVDYGMKAMRFYTAYPNICSLLALLVMSGVLYIFFRKSPAIPDLRYSELVVALVYTSCMLSIYSIVCDFFAVDDNIELALQLTALIPLKQLSGFSAWRTAAYLVFSALLLSVLLMAFFILCGVAVSLFLLSA